MSLENSTISIPLNVTNSTTVGNHTAAPVGPPAGDPLVIYICVILGFISVFGTLGNGLVIYVFTRKSDKVTSTIFILALAWTDLFTCMVIVPFTVVNIQANGVLVYDVACKIYQFLITFNVPLSAFIMVAIAVDRYFSICHPFLHAVTPRRARIAIMCLCFFAFTLGTITALMFSVYQQVERNVTALRGEVSWCPNITLEDYNFTMDDPSTMMPVDVQQNNNMASTSRPYLTLTYSNSQALQIVVNDDNFKTTTDAINNTLVVNKVSCERTIVERVYGSGFCDMNPAYFSLEFIDIYANIQASLYGISLLTVFTLYFFIYRSVVRRRAWRRKQKSWSHSPMTAAPAPTSFKQPNNTSSTKTTWAPSDDAQQENMELISKKKKDNSEKDESSNNGNGSSGGNGTTTTSSTTTPISDRKENGTPLDQEVTVKNGSSPPTSKILTAAEKKTSRERRDFNFLANIRTAVMLFVVAVVFIFCFVPSWLMASGLIPFNVIVFYMYFSYNSANPVIYAFMNQSFRKELKRVFQRDFPICKIFCKTKPRLSRDLEESKTIHTIYSACESPVDAMCKASPAAGHPILEDIDDSVDEDDSSSIVEAAIAASSQANV